MLSVKILDQIQVGFCLRCEVAVSFLDFVHIDLISPAPVIEKTFFSLWIDFHLFVKY